MRGGKECPFSGITSSGRVWWKDNGKRSLGCARSSEGVRRKLEDGLGQINYNKCISNAPNPFV